MEKRTCARFPPCSLTFPQCSGLCLEPILHTSSLASYCQDDYLSLFGAKCGGCNELIQGAIPPIVAIGQEWHPGCFTCRGLSPTRRRAVAPRLPSNPDLTTGPCGRPLAGLGFHSIPDPAASAAGDALSPSKPDGKTKRKKRAPCCSECYVARMRESRSSAITVFPGGSGSRGSLTGRDKSSEPGGLPWEQKHKQAELDDTETPGPS